MFEILVIYKIKENVSGADFINELTQKGVIGSILAEDGCIKYDYYMPFVNGDTVLLHEIWESDEHQRIHMTQPHMKLAMEIKQKYVDCVELKKLTDL